MLINRKAVKQYALECGGKRAKKFTRVSKEFYEIMEVKLRGVISTHIQLLPSKGKTIK